MRRQFRVLIFLRKWILRFVPAVLCLSPLLVLAAESSGSLDLNPIEKEVQAFNQTITNHLKAIDAAQKHSSGGMETLWTILGIVLVVALIVLLKYGRKLFGGSGEMVLQSHVAPEPDEKLAASEEKAYETFAEGFKRGPRSNLATAEPVSDLPASPVAPEPVVTQPAGPAEIESEVSEATAPEIPEEPEPLPNLPAPLELAMQLWERMETGPWDAQEPEKLNDHLIGCLKLATHLKSACEPTPYVTAWQISAAMEGLLNQLVSRPGSSSSSAVQTVAGAVELVVELIDRKLEGDVVNQTPVKLLAVDDDALCRHAIAFALKKALASPDLASDATAALRLVENTQYDAIFLDIEMPGMNGLDLCRAIRTSDKNATTPVVFITSHRDYESQKDATMAGGSDFMIKPFLTFEVTLKALIFLVRQRLQEPAAIPAATAISASASVSPA